MLLAALLPGGCGSGYQSCAVKGTVTYLGKPLPQGAIRFVVDQGTPGAGGVAQVVDGKYEVLDQEMIAGSYLVMISGFEETGRMLRHDGNSPLVKEIRQYLPGKYNASSTLRIKLDPGENVKDFDL